MRCATHYSCPCSDLADVTHPDGALSQGDAHEEDEEQTLNPYNPRANFALYPLDHLLFCIECHELRCPRCYYEEVIYYYCPSCLLETPTATVKGETNRCTRSCSQCPLCFASLALQSYPDPDVTRTGSENPATKDGPFILACPYCAWSTLDVGITLEKSININGQLKKIYAQQVSADDERPRSPVAPESPTKSRLAHETTADSFFDEDEPSDAARRSNADLRVANADPFTALATFYKSQLAETTPSGPFGLSSTYGLDSPSQLSRLLSTFGVGSVKKQRGRVPLMREALSRAEGLHTHALPDSTLGDAVAKDTGDSAQQIVPDVNEQAIIDNLSYDTRLSPAQMQAQLLHPHNPAATTSTCALLTTSKLKPIPTTLRAKRAKRCRTCRNNLLRPEEKRQSTRFKIRLLALNYIPKLTCTPLLATATPLISTQGAGPLAADTVKMIRNKPNHYLLHFRNPLYEACRITLATPQSTATLAGAPCKAKVTILCPTFEIGATTDAWNEALDGNNAAPDPKRESLKAGADEAKEKTPEAGKIWARGRNWTSVVLEVVPQSAPSPADEADQELEIPVFVRMEYDADEVAAGSSGSGTGLGLGSSVGSGDGKPSDKEAPKRGRVRRELAYWCVVGVGRVA